MDNRNDNPAGEPEGRLPVPQSSLPPGQALVPSAPGGLAVATGFTRDSREDPGEIDLRVYWRMLLKRKWWILSAAIFGLAMGLLMALMATPIYLAGTTVQIQERTMQVVNVGDTTPMRSGWSNRGFFETQLELIRSRALMQRVAADMGLASGEELGRLQSRSGWQNLLSKVLGESAESSNNGEQDPFSAMTPEQLEGMAIGRLMGGVSVMPVGESELVRIQFTSTDPRFAVRAVNAVAEGYVTSNLERRFDSSAYAKSYLEDRLAELKVKLEDSERELVEFAQKEEIIGTQGSAGNLTEQNLDSVNAAFSTARAERVRIETRWRMAQASTGAVLAGMNDAGALYKTLQDRRASLMSDYQNKLAIYKPNFPSMLELKAQIDEIERQLDQEAEAIKGAIKAEYDAAVAQEKVLAGMLNDMKAEVLDLQSRSIQYNILKREVDTNRELYEGLLQRYKEIGVAAGVSTNNIAIIDRAQWAGRIKPNPPFNMAFGLFLGLLAGVALALLLEFLDDTVKTPEDVETKLCLVSLGVVPKLPKQTTPQAALDDVRSAFSEAYRSIRTALQFSTEAGIPSVLAVTSTVPGEGKTTTAVTLARNFVLLGKRVLLIDADLRNPSVHKLLRLDNEKGLSNCLAGAAKPGEAIQLVDDGQLSVLSAGPLPPSPAELLAGARMVSLLTQAVERYDHIIIDSPPVVGLADAPIISNLSRGTLLVVESGRARVGAVQASVKRLLAARARLLGVVLTKYDVRTAGYGYGSYNYVSYDYYSHGTGASASKPRLLARKSR